MRGAHLTGLDRLIVSERAGRLYLNGLSVRQVAVEIHAHYQLARDLIAEADVPFRPSGPQPGTKRRPRGGEPGA
ncbi:helix-turn-helix domain-containing protein [Streptomyces chilikensis]|uniref:Helix-turn-helix domain-containing protein n=1 Tax=Streptomyces chilikensis TaxID=1194079 RepID=A0ABV3EJ84_9ACTN